MKALLKIGYNWYLVPNEHIEAITQMRQVEFNEYEKPAKILPLKDEQSPIEVRMVPDEALVELESANDPVLGALMDRLEAANEKVADLKKEATKARTDKWKVEQELACAKKAMEHLGIKDEEPVEEVTNL